MKLDARSFNRGALMQWSIRLGASKPAVLQQAEKSIWKAMLDIVNRPGDYLTILNDLASAFPSTYIQELERQSETVTGWFNIDLQHSTNPLKGHSHITHGTPSRTSALSQSSLLSQSGEDADSDSHVGTSAVSLPSQASHSNDLQHSTNLTNPQPLEGHSHITHGTLSRTSALSQSSQSGEGTDSHVTQQGTSAVSLPSQASHSNERANSESIVPHVTQSGTSAVTSPSQSNEEANSHLQHSTVPHVTETGTSAASPPSQASHSNDDANVDAGRKDQEMDKDPGETTGGDNEDRDAGGGDQVNRDAGGEDRIEGNSGVGDKRTFNGMDVDEDRDAGEGLVNGDGGTDAGGEDRIKGKSGIADKAPNVMDVDGDAGGEDLVNGDGGTRDEEANNRGTVGDEEANNGLTAGDEVANDGDTAGGKEANGGDTARVDNMVVDEDAIEEAPPRSTRPRNSHPIEHSRSSSSSAPKKQRNRHPASAEQATSSQKRVILDETLKILVVCILHFFSPTVIQHDFQEKPQSATLQDSDAKEVYFGEAMTVYDIEGNPRIFTPRLNACSLFLVL